MRALCLSLMLVAPPALADDIALGSRVSDVTLYPQGATVTREVPFAAPEGAHELILADLPRGTPLASVRVSVEGARIGGVTTRRDYVPPRDIAESPDLLAARAEVERLEEALRTARAGIEDIRLEAEAARARLAFLDRIGQGDDVATLDLDRLRALSQMIGSETLAARQVALDATRRAEAATRALADQDAALKDARRALAALVPEQEARAMLAVAITAETATEGRMTVTYTIPNAGWQPLYDLHLARDSGALRIERGALVRQSTGENWQDVALSLSTSRPSEQTEPGQIWPWVPRVVDPEEVRPLARQKGGEAAMSLAAPMAEMADSVTAEADFDGLSVTYRYPAPVDVATGADHVRLMLGTLEAEAEIVAQAVPMVDQTAYVMADFTNDTGEILLPTSEARFYLDGRYVGQRGLDLIAAGEDAKLSFGPVDGLRLSRVLRDRNEGDRGLVRKSNEMSESVMIEVENLTDTVWPLRVIDRVPVSEQEDLEITWSASPEPTGENVDDRRGILAWEFDLPAGATQTIRLDTAMEWPGGKVLR
ncbi:hypothetical protein RA2_02969 [Roseovarius sp. A-2]|uniref:DUF4139 domain-containing protein n=1 Tax=Roseovarius sp. A-2 TaxID=1570360 RepID=UPI0009B53038|nr:DUF4139 domain-containing protein [Roseovarius sp. A-2]GAW35901.1 hypothetical protein RA2_02969 [Roseovarius sp. A-2]